MIFIDAAHDYDNKKRDTENAFRLLSSRGVILWHDFGQIEEAILGADKIKGKPSVIIARTTKGKGVSFMENDNIFHYKALSDQEYQESLKELNG